MPKKVSEEGVVEKGMHELLVSGLCHLGRGNIYHAVNRLFGDVGYTGFAGLREY
jgi:hypothetical protein